MRPDDTDINASSCVCPNCPTYDDCMRGNDERLYCSRGKTECKPASKGCICEECPVWADYDLTSLYFCLKGAAEQ